MLSDLFHHRTVQQNQHQNNAPTALLSQGLHAITNVTGMIAQLIPHPFYSNEYETESESDASEGEALENLEEDEADEEEEDESEEEAEELEEEDEVDTGLGGLEEESLLELDAVFWL